MNNFKKNFKKNKNNLFHEYIRDEIRDLLKEKIGNTPIKFFWDREQKQEKPYVVYNTEDFDLPEKNISEYNYLLTNAIQVYEYSEKNLHYRPSNIFVPYLPNLDSHYINCYKEIEVLSYGCLLTRRKEIIDSLKKQYEIYHVDNMSLGQMADLIKKSKWVLSVGSSTNIHNDLLRVTPALNLGANILLEQTQEIWYNKYLKKNFSKRIKFYER